MLQDKDGETASDSDWEDMDDEDDTYAESTAGHDFTESGIVTTTSGSSFPHLCQCCRDITFARIENPKDDNPLSWFQASHRPSLEALQESAKGGCHFCCQLWWGLCAPSRAFQLRPPTGDSNAGKIILRYAIGGITNHDKVRDIEALCGDDRAMHIEVIQLDGQSPLASSTQQYTREVLKASRYICKAREILAASR